MGADHARLVPHPGRNATNGYDGGIGGEYGIGRANLLQTAWMFGDDELGQATRKRSLSRIPLGRLAEVEDLIGMALYLLSPASDFCTGQVMYVDGGYTAG